MDPVRLARVVVLAVDQILHPHHNPAPVPKPGLIEEELVLVQVQVQDKDKVDKLMTAYLRSVAEGLCSSCKQSSTAAFERKCTSVTCSEYSTSLYKLLRDGVA